MVVNAGADPVSIPLEVPELAGTRLTALSVAALPAGTPTEIDRHGAVVVAVPARTGFILAGVA